LRWGFLLFFLSFPSYIYIFLNFGGRQQGNKDEARVKFARAVHAYPLLWSAWLELVSSCTDFADATKVFKKKISIKKHPPKIVRQVAAMELPDHPVRPFFDALLALELHQNDLAVELYTSLVKQYPRNQHAAANLALAHYNLRGAYVFVSSPRQFLID
jgi:tetratricopeptide (TPR) repeat protein